MRPSASSSPPLAVVPFSPPPNLSASARRLRRHFDRGAALTRQEIATHIGCVPRHASRLVEELRDAGVPVQEQRQGRAKVYSLAAEHQHRTIQVEELDEAALRALVVAAEASRALLRDTPLADPLDRAFGVLLAAYRGDDLDSFEPEAVADQWHFGALAAPGVGTLATLRQLDEAIRSFQSVEVVYVNGRGERSTRVLDPLAVAPFSSGWQLAAWCHRRRAVRDFRPDRIERIRPLDAHFSPPADWNPDVHFDGRFGALDGDGRLQRVQLRVDRSVIQHFRSGPYHPSQTITPDGDGFAVTFQVPELKAIRSWVRSWGPAVTALAPAELVDALANDAHATATLYDASPSRSPAVHERHRTGQT